MIQNICSNEYLVYPIVRFNPLRARACNKNFKPIQYYLVFHPINIM